MNGSVVETVLAYLMLARFASLAFARYGIVTGVSLVGGSGPHEGTVQLVGVSDDGSQLSLVTGPLVRFRSQYVTAICRTLGYPGVNRVFYVSPYMADIIEETSFDLRCIDYPSVIGCPAYVHDHPHRDSAVKCQTDTGYLGCFGDDQAARPLANSTCPPSPNSNYSCIDRDNMTTESCLEYCKTLNGCDNIFTYAGVRAGIECTCGLNTTELGNLTDSYDGSCYSPCSGDRNYSNCGGPSHIAAFNITSEPDEQEATTHCVHSSPDPADTDAATTADTTTSGDATSAKPDGDSCFRRSDGNAGKQRRIKWYQWRS